MFLVRSGCGCLLSLFWSLFISLFFTLAFSFAPVRPAQAAGAIEWALENPFRLFRSPAMTRFHQITNAELSATERALPILSSERRLSQHLPRGWAETIFDDTCWSRERGAYSACVDARSYLTPKSHKIWASYQPGGGAP